MPDTPETAPAIVVRKMDGTEVKRIAVSNPTRRKVDTVMSGLLRNMDTANYYADDSDFDHLTD